MKSVILEGNSEKALDLIIALAKELGIKAKFLTEEQIEDAGLSRAIKSGRTGKFVDTEKFLQGLK